MIKVFNKNYTIKTTDLKLNNQNQIMLTLIIIMGQNVKIIVTYVLCHSLKFFLSTDLNVNSQENLHAI